MINKNEHSESDISAKFITPAIENADWGEMTQIRREVTLTPGPVTVRGNVASRNHMMKKFADVQRTERPRWRSAKDNKPISLI